MSKKKSVVRKNKLTEKEVDRRVLGASAGAGGFLGAGSIATALAGKLVNTSDNTGYKVSDILKHAPGKADHTKVYQVADPRQSHYNPALTAADRDLAHMATGQGGKYVGIPKTSASLAAHEIAHSRGGMLNTKLGRAAYDQSKKFSSPMSKRGLLMPGYGIYKGMKGEELSNGEIAGSLAVSAPMVLEETRANVNAYRTLRNMKKAGLGRRSIAPLIGSQLSYMAAAASPYIANKAALAGRRLAGGNPVEG
jgi:hypothetical protein